MLTYNAQVGAFGYVRLLFDWQPSGAIIGSLMLKGMPAVPYGVSMGEEIVLESASWRYVLNTTGQWCRLACSSSHMALP